VIKADYFLDPENKKQQCVNLINEVGLTNVKLIWGELTTVQLFELYNFADVYVTATRAEGWGLPIIEAAATGLPIIAPFYSGHTEFLKHLESSVLKVEHQLVEIDDFEFKKFWPTEDQVFGKWAFTDIQKLAQKLKFISINAEEFSKDSILNASLIDKNFDWKNSVLIGLRSLLNNNILILR